MRARERASTRREECSWLQVTVSNGRPFDERTGDQYTIPTGDHLMNGRATTRVAPYYTRYGGAMPVVW